MVFFSVSYEKFLLVLKYTIVHIVGVKERSNVCYLTTLTVSAPAPSLASDHQATSDSALQLHIPANDNPKLPQSTSRLSIPSTIPSSSADVVPLPRVGQTNDMQSDGGRLGNRDEGRLGNRDEDHHGNRDEVPVSARCGGVPTDSPNAQLSTELPQAIQDSGSQSVTLASRQLQDNSELWLTAKPYQLIKSYC